MTQDEKDMISQLKATDERRARIKKFALTLLEQCKDENLTIAELQTVVDAMVSEARRLTTLRDGLALL